MLAYLITCHITKKQYIGITSRSVTARWASHISNSIKKTNGLSRAIREYGKNNFTVEVICCAKNWGDLCETEKILISQYGTKWPNGYNFTKGGSSRCDYIKSPEQIEKSAAHHRGKVLSEFTKQAISKAHRGKVLTKAHREKLSIAKTGKKLSPRSAQHSARISDGLRKAWAKRKNVNLL